MLLALTTMFLTQEQRQQQRQLQALLDDVTELKQGQDVLAEETGVSQKISGVAMWNRIVGLEEECDHFSEVTGRLEKYVEEMLRKMLGTLDQGTVTLMLNMCTQMFISVHRQGWRPHAYLI